ncbi:MAG TPA: SDR family oxidoreductase [Dongiaceae bacterium]|nr:SDR family oxidoreductase [Dongiaceae bacterium]
MATILITGANRGIGLALTRAFVAHGDKVIAAQRAAKPGGELAALQKESGRVDIIGMDVAVEASVAKAAAALKGTPIDIVVNNAAVLNSYAGIEDQVHDEAAWHSVLMTNVAGSYFVAAHFLPNLKLSKHARLIFMTSSMSSLSEANGGAYPYRASKAAVNSLCRNLARDLAGDGIAVAAFDPGWVRTDMGGANASISAETSAAGLLKRILALSLKTTGAIEKYSGEKVAL